MRTKTGRAIAMTAKIIIEFMMSRWMRKLCGGVKGFRVIGGGP